MLRFRLVSAALFSLTLSAWAADPVSLFDGKTLKGWEGEAKWWRVEDGMITGGSRTQTVPRNEFLATVEEYDHFVLRLKFKLTGTQGFINSGVQIRSQRVPNDSEMAGYQCDLGDPSWWGSIYDESRRNRVMAPSDMEAVNKVLRRNEWNDYEIRAEGPRVTTVINGVTAVEYTEEDESIPDKGHIGIQVHGGGAALIQVKDISIEKLPAPPAAPKFKGAPEPEKAVKESPLTPEEQRASFSLPPGFSMELVAAESEGIGKFIAVDWDHAGRLWTMTALDYPVDANENRPQAEALFAKGGQDRVLVIDNPSAPGPHTPRVWAEGLALPLGILPHKNGAYVQYGHEIRYYRDKDGDGKADTHEVVLTGFGIDDSHLFPHQFTRGPGGWIYLAQGAFNHGDVRRPDGKPFTTGGLFGNGAESVKFSYCKLARMRPDGSDFQLVTSGPNNIWGLALTSGGEMFIQEANDTGYPVYAYEPGVHVPGIGNDKLKPYAPIAPATLTPPQMGGTGLSGLAVSEGADGWSAPYGDNPDKVFYLANPITCRIQAVRARATADGGYRYSKLEDFCISSDPWFRPVGMAFGPDGCLYIVDWYNRVISHNEVPRNHPDRDRTRGRIWRIRQNGQPAALPPDLTKLTPPELAGLLSSPRAWTARHAALELTDRGESAAAAAVARDAAKPAAARVAALEVLGSSPGGLPAADARLALTSPDRNVRRTAASCQPLTEFSKDADPLVRHAFILASVDLPALLGMTPPPGGAYEAEFTRFLLRGIFEKHAAGVTALLDSSKAAALPVEGRLLAALALDPAASAARVVRLLPELKRGPNDEELLRLTEALDQPEAAAALASLVARPESLEAILRVKNRFSAAAATPVLTKAALDLLSGDAAARGLALRLAGAFRLTGAEAQILTLLQSGDEPARLGALAALREIGCSQPEVFPPLVNAGGALRGPALAALAASPSPQAPGLLLGLLATLSETERRPAVEALASTPAGAAALTAGLLAGSIPDSALDGPLADKLQTVLGAAHPEFVRLMESRPGLFQSVLALDGEEAGLAEAAVTLTGPFTVESWMKLAPGISNEDSLLGSNGNGPDFNFYDGTFRVYCGGAFGDALAATRRVDADVWTHVAVTRDDTGAFRIFLNGALDAEGGKKFAEPMGPLHLGGSNVKGGTAAAYSEFRVWNRALTAEEILAGFSRAYSGGAPTGLVKRFSGDQWPALHGSARIARAADAPKLLTDDEARALDAQIERYREIAARPGDVEAGRLVFGTCLTCHNVRGEGGKLAPPLDGSAGRPVEHVLRAMLTPDAAVEGGYRLFRVKTKDGSLAEGFLVSRDEKAIVLRMIGGAEQRIESADVSEAGPTPRSVMSLMYPAAFQALPDQSVADLFRYLGTLK